MSTFEHLLFLPGVRLRKQGIPGKGVKYFFVSDDQCFDVLEVLVFILESGLIDAAFGRAINSEIVRFERWHGNKISRLLQKGDQGE